MYVIPVISNTLSSSQTDRKKMQCTYRLYFVENNWPYWTVRLVDVFDLSLRELIGRTSASPSQLQQHLEILSRSSHPTSTYDPAFVQPQPKTAA
ncbi:hypothetical protein KL904_000217 [Ogataea polymorpha]|nr:hypothetical protein KL904_000217 [Ogataea polymorpha]